MAKRDPLIRRARRNPAVLRRALRNPEKRARLPENMVPRKFRPIVPGSAVTNKQLNRESRAASRIKYGPISQAQRQQVGEAKAWQRDVGNYYDDYLKQVQAQSQNVNQIGQQAQQAVQNTQAGVTGLAAADLTQMNQAATKDAAARGATPGDLAQMASGAAATRQALVGSFGAQQAATNAANSNYASNRANVVAPGQKLGAVAQAHGRVRQAGENLAETRREKGAFRFTYGQERKADEAKNVLAAKALGLDVFKAQADVAATKAAGKRDAADARRDAIKGRRETPQAREGAKYGYGPKEWKRLGSSGRTAIIKANKSKPADSVYTSGAFAGRKKSEINGMSSAERQRLVDAYANRKPGGGGGGDGNGPTPATPARTQSLREEIARAQLSATAYKQGRKGQYHAMPRPDARGQLIQPPNAVGDTAARVALDIAYDGRISKRNKRMLKRLGYSPRQLGLGKYTRGYSPPNSFRTDAAQR